MNEDRAPLAHIERRPDSPMIVVVAENGAPARVPHRHHCRCRLGRSPRNGPRCRARVRSVPQRSRGYQENASSSIERR